MQFFGGMLTMPPKTAQKDHPTLSSQNQEEGQQF
jgi:hypothetical protein